MPDPTIASVPAPVEATPERPTFPGVTTARNQRVIAAEFEGEIQRLTVHQRQRVKAGDVVATLDADALRAEAAGLRQQETSERAQAGAFGATARSAAQQARTEALLYRRGFQSRNAVGSARARYGEAAGQASAAIARAHAARAKRTQLEELIAKAAHVSPIDGVITMVRAKEGEVAQKGTPLARVFDDRDLVIRFAVPKEHRATVRVGARVELNLPGGARPIWATVERIADEEPPITFAIVLADIDDRRLRPDEIQVASEGRVRIADAQPGAPRGANDDHGTLE